MRLAVSRLFDYICTVNTFLGKETMMLRPVILMFLLAVTLPVVGQANHYTERVESFRAMRAVDSTDVVMLGSSQTEYAGDWNKLLTWRHVRNRGIAGDDIQGMMARLGQVTKGHPKALFLMAGIDELNAGLSVDVTFDRCVELITQIRRLAPGTKLFVQSVLPINEDFNQWPGLKGRTQDVARLNVKLRHYCQAHHIAYINLFRSFVRHGTNEMRRELTQDGLHLSPFGYKLWAFELRKYLLGL